MPVCDWVYAYINNIIYETEFFDYLLLKLFIIFKILVTYNIFIKLSKIFMNYSNVKFFSQKINTLSQTVAKKKLNAIILL